MGNKTCTAFARRTGKRCRRSALPTSDVCAFHYYPTRELERSGEPDEPDEEELSERLAVFYEALRLGVTIPVAAGYARIPVNTIYDWLGKGADGDPRYREFLENTAYHAACAVVDVVRQVRSNPTQAVRWLEYRYPLRDQTSTRELEP